TASGSRLAGHRPSEHRLPLEHGPIRRPSRVPGRSARALLATVRVGGAVHRSGLATVCGGGGEGLPGAHHCGGDRSPARHSDDGVAVFKTDFGEGLPDDAALADGTPPAHAHNLFPLRYNAAVSDGIGEHTGRNPLVWGRSGWAGSHRYPGQWGGDAESTVAGMQATLRGGLSYAISAPGFWSHDIGGFFGPELTPALYVRWTQFGAFSPLMRAHGLRPREPWEFGEQALAISRTW